MSEDDARIVSATEAAKSFGRLVNQVRETQATYVVERGGVPVARISPIARRSSTIRDLKTLLRDSGRAGEEYLRGVEDAVARHTRPRVRRNPWGR